MRFSGTNFIFLMLACVSVVWTKTLTLTLNLSSGTLNYDLMTL